MNTNKNMQQRATMSQATDSADGEQELVNRLFIVAENEERPLSEELYDNLDGVIASIELERAQVAVRRERAIKLAFQIAKLQDELEADNVAIDESHRTMQQELLIALYLVVESEVTLGSDPIENTNMLSARMTERYNEILSNLAHMNGDIQKIESKSETSTDSLS